jgi:hypothetical protein
MSFFADIQDVKVLIKETTEAKIEFHERYWKNVSSQGWHLCQIIYSGSLRGLVSEKLYQISPTP